MNTIRAYLGDNGATWTVDPAIPPPPKNAPYREGIRSLFDVEDIQ
jgi:hypothetical protein